MGVGKKRLVLLFAFAIVLVVTSFSANGNEVSYMLGSINDSTLSDEAEIGSVVLTEFGKRVYLGSNQWSYFTQMGLSNTWNGTHWVRWIYNQTAKSVRIGNVTLTHLQGGSLQMTTESGLTIGRLKWYSQYYAGGQWQNVSLPNYQWLGFDVNETHGIANQRFWGSTGELVVSYIYRNNEEFKITVNVTNNAVQDVPVRIFWVAHDLQDVAGNYELIYEVVHDKNQTVGIRIEDLNIFWMDAKKADPNIAVNTILDKPNRRAAVIFGNQSSILPAGHTYTLDPSVNPVMAADGDDDCWYLAPAPAHYTTYLWTDMTMTGGGTQGYNAQWRFALSIPQGATVDSADLNLYETLDGYDYTDDSGIWRIDETNVGSLEADTVFPARSNTTRHDQDLMDAVANEWVVVNVTNLVHEQVNLGGWSSGYAMGFRMWWITGHHSSHYKHEDYQAAGTNHAYLNVTYTTGGTTYEAYPSGSISLGGDTSLVAAFSKTLSETFALGGLTSLIAAFAKTLVESFALAGITDVSVIIQMLIQDTFALVGVTSLVGQYSVLLSVGFALTGGVALAGSYVLTLVEGFTLAGTITAFKVFIVNLVEGFTVGVGIDITAIIGTSLIGSIFFQLFLGVNMWGYLGPMALVIGGYFAMKKATSLGVIWFIVEVVVMAQYFALVEATPEYWWSIFIIMLGSIFTIAFPLWSGRK